MSRPISNPIPAATRLEQDQHREHRLAHGPGERDEVPRKQRVATWEARARTAREALRQTHHRHHAAAKAAGAYFVTAKVAGRQRQQDHAVGRRYRDRPKAAFKERVLFRRRCRHGRAGRREPTSSSSAGSIEHLGAAASMCTTKNFAEQTDDKTVKLVPDQLDVEGRLSVARHRPRRTAGGSRISASAASGTGHITTTGIQRGQSVWHHRSARLSTRP